MRTRTLIFTLVIAIGSSAAAFAASDPVIVRGWKPYVGFAGGGDTPLAIKRLREVVGFTEAWLKHTEFDGRTGEFIDDIWEALEDFDLRDLYDLLPEKSGNWRVLKVYGKQIGSKYLIGQPPAGQNFEVNSRGTRKKLGDISLVIQSREAPAADKRINYLIQARIGVGVGVISWKNIAEANMEIFRLLASGDPRSPSHPRDEVSRGPAWTRYRVIKTNPGLGPEDVEVLALGWSAFPKMAELLTTLGRVEDLLTIEKDSDGSYQHLTPSFRIAREPLRRKYPRVAKYLDSLEFLDSKTKIDLMDESGRLIRANIDTRANRISFDVYVQNGKILPFSNGKVRTDAPVDLYQRPADRPWRLVALSDMQMDVMGIQSVIKNARTEFDYRVDARGATVKARTTKVPYVSVKGNAMGIMPSAIIDFFIPGSLESLVRQFIETACKGNGGEGIAVDTRMDQSAADQPATFDTSLSFEALDNFFVKFGVSVMNDRMIPDEETWEEMLKIFQDLQAAFSADLERFAKVSNVP